MKANDEMRVKGRISNQILVKSCNTQKSVISLSLTFAPFNPV